MSSYTVESEHFSEFARDVLRDFWGHGDFIIVVEEEKEECEKEGVVTRTEFRVSPVLLSRASPVFKTMIKQDNFMEGATSQVILKDASTAAVEAFLRFLHFGKLEGSISTILEVAMLADKYEVTGLHKLCQELAGGKLTAKKACAVFRLADHFQHEELRRDALRKILTNPLKALKVRPALGPRLVQEILATQALCITGKELTALMSGWTKAETREAESAQHLFEAYAAGEEQAYLRHTASDVLYRLRPGASLQNFLGRAAHVALCTGATQYLIETAERITYNRTPFNVEDGWVVWMLPFVSVYLTGFAFSEPLPSSEIHFKVFCSRDGKDWHLCLDSRLCDDIFKERPYYVTCEHFPQVKWLKLHVLEGCFHSTFDVRGIIVQADWPGQTCERGPDPASIHSDEDCSDFSSSSEAEDADTSIL